MSNWRGENVESNNNHFNIIHFQSNKTEKMNIKNNNQKSILLLAARRPEGKNGTETVPRENDQSSTPLGMGTKFHPG